jgi:ComF family protein
MEIVRQLAAAIMPAACLLCGNAGGRVRHGLCPGCLGDLPVSGAACYRCGGALPVDGLCGRCLSRPPPFDCTVSAFAYRYPVDHLIRRLKYREWLAAGRALAPVLARRIHREGGALPEALLPVPLHRLRLLRRGYNQARVIADLLAGELELPVAGRLARRRRATPEQARLSLPARRRNLRGAFALRGPPRWRHLAIVDDVMTSGATVGELARLLRQNGVERIDVWVLARTQSE